MQKEEVFILPTIFWGSINLLFWLVKSKSIIENPWIVRVLPVARDSRHSMKKQQEWNWASSSFWTPLINQSEILVYDIQSDNRTDFASSYI